MFQEIIFYIFAFLLVLSAIMVITLKNPVHAALSLIVSFFASAALWLLIEAEFLAITLVLVYVGAVMVLFLFVVMMLDINTTSLREGFTKYLPIGAGIALVMILSMSMIVGPKYFGADVVKPPASNPLTYNNTEQLGIALYTEYIYPFEIAGAILLVAIIAAIALTMRERRQSKAQSIDQQVAVQKADRLKIIKISNQSN